jgi:hypothetical protein
MNKVNLDLDDLTNAALKRMVKQLLTSSDADEQSILEKLDRRAKKPEKNDLADLDEEMHGKPNTPEVEPDDPKEDEEDDFPDVPKKKKA